MKPPPQIPGESDGSYELFVRWLHEIPAGSLKSAKPAAEALGVSYSKMATAKSRFKWIERRTESGWDAQMVEQRQREVVVAELADHPDQVKDYATTSYTQWRTLLAATACDIAEHSRKAGDIVQAYLSMVHDGEQPPTHLRDAAALILRHFFPPELTKSALIDVDGPGRESKRIRSLGLDNPVRAAENMRAVADRISAAADITDPRPGK